MTYIKEKMNLKTTVIALSAALTLALLASITGFDIASAADENTSPNELTAIPEIPSAPKVLGCYHYTKETGWLNVPCMPQEIANELPRPTIGSSHGVRGVSDSTDDIQSYGLVDIEFSEYSGETDSIEDISNTWSIQTNTNRWQIGGSGDWYVVQFTEQNHGTNSNARAACVWQINVSDQDYDPTCISVSLQTLSSSYHGSVEGKVLTNGNLQTQYCNMTGTTQCWVVTASDDNELADNWIHTSGMILGFGSGSEAEFDSPTTLTAEVSTGPAQAASAITDTGTQETANLDYDNSSTSCAFSICTRTSTVSN